MATGILIAVTVVLIAAAGYVGFLLLRLSRPATRAAGRQTVGDLVRRRSAASDDVQGADDRPGTDDLAGADLFRAKDPQAVAAVPPPPDDVLPRAGGSSVADVTPAGPAPLPATTPPDGVEVGDAPWRRAARMMGSEPGAAWETAPVPVVPPQEAAAPARETPRPRPIAPVAEQPRQAVPVPDRAEAGRTAVLEAPAPVANGSHVVTEAAPAEVAPEDPAPAPVESGTDAEAPAPEAPSRPLSDPDLTPLMGIPLVRPVGDSPVPPLPVVVPVPAADPEPATGSVSDSGPAAQPVTPRLSRPSAIDDDVVSLVPAASTPRAAVTGSPQPVWFRVVRRDGEPVGGVLVTLLDDHGQEADATKTATDGGGELRAPHGGWFLMIASAEGFQPRAVTLAVDEQPVEIALLLPRSATVAGTVREDGGAPAAGTRVVAFQEGEVVDELVTDRDGGYRFDDLAEGVYALSAVGVRGSAVGRVTLSEGADGQLDLDLRRPDGAS